MQQESLQNQNYSIPLIPILIWASMVHAHLSSAHLKAKLSLK